MNLKSLISKVIPSAIIAMGIYSFEASAQPGPPPQQQDGIIPYFTAHLWVGEDYRGAYETSPGVNTQHHKEFQINPSPSGNTEFGVKGKMGNLYVQGSMAALYNPPDKSLSPDIGNMFFKYVFFNDLYLQVGKNAVPWAGLNIYDSAGDDGMVNEMASGRSPIFQAQVNFKGFYIDVMEASSDVGSDISLVSQGGVPKIVGSYTRDDYNARIPMFAIGYATPGFQPIMVKATFIYQNVKIDDSSSAVNGKNIVSYSANATVDANVADFIFHVHGFYSQNQGDMGLASWCYDRSVVDGDKIKDTKGYGGNAGVAYRLGPTTFAIGAGYEIYDNDCFAKKDDQLVYFASLSYNVMPNFIISPVFKVFDYKKGTGKAQGVTGAIPNPAQVDPINEGKEYKFGVLFIVMM